MCIMSLTLALCEYLPTHRPQREILVVNQVWKLFYFVAQVGLAALKCGRNLGCTSASVAATNITAAREVT